MEGGGQPQSHGFFWPQSCSDMIKKNMPRGLGLKEKIARASSCRGAISTEISPGYRTEREGGRV